MLESVEDYKAATINMFKNFINEERELSRQIKTIKRNQAGPGTTQKYEV